MCCVAAALVKLSRSGQARPASLARSLARHDDPARAGGCRILLSLLPLLLAVELPNLYDIHRSPLNLLPSCSCRHSFWAAQFDARQSALVGGCEEFSSIRLAGWMASEQERTRARERDGKRETGLRNRAICALITIVWHVRGRDRDRESKVSCLRASLGLNQRCFALTANFLCPSPSWTVKNASAV